MNYEQKYNEAPNRAKSVYGEKPMDSARCIGCVYFIPAHIGGTDLGEYIKAECAIHATLLKENCKDQEYKDQ